MLWPVLMALLVATGLAMGVGAATYVAHLHGHTPSSRAAEGSHRTARAGRRRPGGALSVDRLRAREHAHVPHQQGRPASADWLAVLQPEAGR